MGVSFREFAFRNMIWLGHAFWVLVSSCVARVLWTLFAKFSRVSNERSRISEVSDDETRQKPDVRNEASKEENSFDSLSVSNALTSRYEFLTGNSFCGYIEEPLNTSFKVQELFLDSVFEEFDHRGKTGHSVAFEVDDQCKSQGFVCTDPSSDTRSEEDDDYAKEDVLACSESIANKNSREFDDQLKSQAPDSGEPHSGKDFQEVDKVYTDASICDELFFSEDHQLVDNQGTPESSICKEPSLEKDSQQVGDEGESGSSLSFSSDDEEALNLSHEDCIGGRSDFSAITCVSCESASEKQIRVDPDEFSDEVQPLWGDQLVSSDYVNQEEPSIPSNDFWHTNGKFIADFGEIYCCERAGEVSGPETPACLDTNSVDLHQEDVSSSDSGNDPDDDQKDSVMNHSETEEEKYTEKKPNEQIVEEKSKQSLKKDDEMDLDALLVHQLFVQKMKKEMKHSRSISLPTISEESESPRVDEDLKPLRIDEKMAYKDRVDEIQNFYKSYLDKMRKLDILCHQTLYAVGFLQLKNQDHPANSKKSSNPSIKTLLAHSFLRSKFRRNESDQVKKLLRNLHRDLELVYVGQLCISWEILKWQHAKAEDLQLYDSMGVCRYSLVAGEFQQFQVLVQRFTEDEPFQGPRVDNYVKSRFANSSLLQVPSIKDDSIDGGKKGEGRAVVSIVRLTDKIEESMHAFWEFVRADKKEAGKVVLLDPSDAEMLSDMRANLAKKERRLKDIVRSGNCLVNKFQKQRQCRLRLEVVVAQVELRLVSRVMAMPRLTSDQVLWCGKKLGRISIVGKKVDVESSFLLFPC